MNVNNGQFFGGMDKIPFFVRKLEYLCIWYTGKLFCMCFILFKGQKYGVSWTFMCLGMGRNTC